MSKGIPEHADLMRAARQDSHFSGAIDIARMPRFSEYLASTEGQAEADIRLGTDEHNQAFLQGTASARVRDSSPMILKGNMNTEGFTYCPK